MPCQSYESNWAKSSNDAEVKKLKKEADKLARIACTAMTALEEMGKEDFVLLKNEEVRSWWEQHKIDDAKERNREDADLEKKRIREEALAKLSDAEKKVLGIKV